MRKILLLVLLVVLFFACSNEGLDIKRTPGNVFCQVEQNKCYDVSVEVCEAVGGEEVASCRLESSSSSADIEVGESSSSESDIEPIDSSSSSEEGIDDSSSSGVVGEGDSSSSGEVGGGDSSSSAEAGVEDSSSSGEAGESSSSAIADGSSSSGTAGSSSSVRLSSSSLAPSLTECDFPSYMHKDETIVLPALPSLVGSCPGTAAVNYTLQIGSSSSASLVSTFPISLTAHSGKNLTIRASVQCGAGAPLTKTCNVSVAENYMIFDHNHDPKYTISRGSTVIILSMPAIADDGSPNLPTNIGCEFTPQGTTNVVFYVTTPSKRLSSDGAPNGKQPWWTALPDTAKFAPADYTSNHNRILFETPNEGMKCTTSP
ncbi:MAG: hypothetical protein LBQ76_04955 [Candidatus Fibromonas sp.]|jgi:hypothetical protein|nr:hypothetical protein [Candidatus Fibromonas sp.]